MSSWSCSAPSARRGRCTRQGTTFRWSLAAIAVAGVVLGALYMLRFALGFLFGAAQAPNQPIPDLGAREKAILGAIVVAVFALGLFPDEPMKKTELAAQAYRQLVLTSRLPARSTP